MTGIPQHIFKTGRKSTGSSDKRLGIKLAYSVRFKESLANVMEYYQNITLSFKNKTCQGTWMAQ